jgi:hypothetical protein
MSALEREIIEKFQQLDRDAQQRVLELMVQETGLAEQGSTIERVKKRQSP